MKQKEILTRGKIFALLQRHQSSLKKYKVKRIGLFGSYAAGKQKQRSDIDFLIEFEEPNFDNFMDLAFYLEGLLQRKIDLITHGSISPYIRPYVEKEVRWHEVK